MPNNENEHKSLIEKILEIDNIAKTKIANEQQKENNELKNINFKIKETLKLMEIKSKARLDNLRAFKLTEFEKQMEYLEKEKKNMIEKLENVFKENKENWINSMFKSIVDIN